MDAGVYRLKEAYEAGYYKTEPEPNEQTPFPWQNKTCKDCPFWVNSICQMFTEYRGPQAHICTYFDNWNQQQAQTIIQERQSQAMRRWWEWFNDRGTAVDPDESGSRWTRWAHPTRPIITELALERRFSGTPGVAFPRPIPITI